LAHRRHTRLPADSIDLTAAGRRAAGSVENAMTSRSPSCRFARNATSILFAAALALGVVPSVQAESAIFLIISGMPGESHDDKYRNAIDVWEFDQTVVGKNCPRFAITKFIDRASPPLANAVNRARLLSTATVIAVAVNQEASAEYYKVVMSDVTVLSAEPIIGATAARPAERILLSARSASIVYTPHDDKGGAGTPVTTTLSCL
jgi:type VI protein secretion system component Hcp